MCCMPMRNHRALGIIHRGQMRLTARGPQGNMGTNMQTLDSKSALGCNADDPSKRAPERHKSLSQKLPTIFAEDS